MTIEPYVAEPKRPRVEGVLKKGRPVRDRPVALICGDVDFNEKGAVHIWSVDGRGVVI